MKTKLKISVALTTYNGEKYISEQLDSILAQNTEIDEIVVSDDGSTDNTLEILLRYQSDYSKINVYQNGSKGVISNFENAIKKTSGDVCFLCDQDDIWYPNKVSTVLGKFSHCISPMLVVHSADVVNEKLIAMENAVDYTPKRGFWRNLIKNTAVGAFMAFNKQFKEKMLPFNYSIPMHDWYMILLAEKMKYNVVVMDEKLQMYRRHGGTVTGRSRNGLGTKLKMRHEILKIVKWQAKQIKND